jgi:ferredoxin
LTTGVANIGSPEDRVLASRAVVDETTPAAASVTDGKVIIDRDACMGSGNCVYWAPAVFDLDDDAIATVVGDLVGNEEPVRMAMVNCPTSAIGISES